MPGIMKIGAQVKTNLVKNFNVVYGSVNNKNPRAVYINISGWGDPQDKDDINYNRVIRDIHKKVKQSLYNTLCNDIEVDGDKTIVDLDIRESGIRYGKRSFMNCEITIFMNEVVPISSEYMLNKLNGITKLIIKDVFDSNKYFKFYKKKSSVIS